MQTYPAAGTHSYDGSRPLYSAPPTHPSAYPPSSAADRSLYSTQSAYAPKHDLGPAPDRPLGQDNGAAHESKPHADGGVVQHHPEDEGEHEQEAEYTHDSNGYDSNRNSYTYNNASVPALNNEHHLPSDLAGSPTHQAGSGRATPRTATAPSPYGYQQNGGYGGPVQGHQQSQSARNLYNVMDRNPATNGTGPAEPAYQASELQSAPLTNGYPQPPLLNGNSNGSLKRGRDDDEDSGRPASDGNDMKRRKTMIDTPVAATSPYELNRPASAVSQRRR
jgi:enhanced filamentous growth protein 1